MERCTRLAIVLTVLLLPGLAARPGLAQPEAPPPKPVVPPGPPPTAPQPANKPSATEELLRPYGEKPTGRPSQKSPLELGRDSDSVLEQDLKPAPLEGSDLRYPINLATALRLADARPLVVVAAQSSAWVAEAQLDKDKVLWLPTINFAADYIRHDGNGPDLFQGTNIPGGVNALGQNSPGNIGRPLNQNINFFYSGAGFTYTPIQPSYFYQPVPGTPLLPSPQMRFLTDAIFQPLASRQNLNAKRWAIQGAKNDAMLTTAQAYFNVHRFRGAYAGDIDVVRKGRRLVEIIAELSRDLVSAVEIDQARNLLADMEQEAVSARENWRISSAHLTQVLRLDPRAVVDPLESDHMQISFIAPDRSLDDLIPIGLTNRPELANNQALIQKMLVHIRQEKLRPFLGAGFMNGFQTPYELIEEGGYGIGNGGKMNIWSNRDDITPQFLLIFEQMGLGNLADVKKQRGMASKQIVELFKTQDMVAGDVTRIQADLQSAAARVVQAERELRAALINYNGNIAGLKQTKRFGNVLVQITRPQEAVFSLQLLWTAYNNYFSSVADYNTAQFDLYHALGYPSRELAFLRPAGTVLPVNTSRPAYLPAVGTGAPPSTR